MGRYIPDDVIEEIRSRADIVDVVSSYVPQLKRYGATWKACCPFHQEKTPSFHVDAARQTIRWFWDRLGPLELDDEGIARRGLIVRILVLPGREDEAAESLTWLRNALGAEVAVSLMAQYNPVGKAKDLPGWNRRVSPEAFEPLAGLVEDLGFEQGWVQPCEDETAERMLGDDMAAGYGEVR